MIRLLILLPFIVFQAHGEANYCFDKAQSWQKTLHQKVLSDVGAIPGYHESTSYIATQNVIDMDNLHVSYLFSVTAGNSDGNIWTWNYKVDFDVWLNAGGTVRFCDVISANFGNNSF